jgi:opacity protein-like surface antigen
MKRLLALAAAATLIGGPALAQDTAPVGDPMASTYENTVKIDIAGLWQGAMHFEPDGTYAMESTDGAVKGTWEIKGDMLCTTQSEPAMPENCNPYEARAVGDSWQTTDSASGMVMDITLTEGREDG